MSTSTNDDRAAYSSMEEALAEIRRLRDEVRRLREPYDEPQDEPRDAPQDGPGSSPVPAQGGRVGVDDASGDQAAPAAVATAQQVVPEQAADGGNEWTAPDPDERAALERLERLREAIAHARAERERAVHELRSLVEQGRSTPLSDTREETPPLEERAPSEGAGMDLEPGAHADRGIAPLAPPVALPIEPPVVDPVQLTAFRPATAGEPQGSAVRPATAGEPPAADSVHAPAWTARHVVFLLGAALFVALATFLFSLRWTGPGDGGAPARPAPLDGAATVPGPAPGSAPSAAPAQDVAPGAARPATAARPAPAAVPLRVELRTERESWLRVMVDGERRLERLVPAGQTLVLDAASTVVVRAGDAGAVTVSVNGGAPEVMGRDGRVADRTYTAVLPQR
jgi:hypothetical protein